MNPIDEYIAAQPPEARPLLAEIRAIVRSAVPDCTEIISYAIPTFDLGGRHLLSCAGYAKHVGIYPAGTTDAALAADLRPYLNGKSTLRFALDRPLPVELIRRFVEARAADFRAKA